jgi:hypothetical protein
VLEGDGGEEESEKNDWPRGGQAFDLAFPFPFPFPSFFSIFPRLSPFYRS